MMLLAEHSVVETVIRIEEIQASGIWETENWRGGKEPLKCT